MPRTIQGTYEDGKVTLSRLPRGVDRARVLVTFLPPRRRPERGTASPAPAATGSTGQMLTPGMFKGAGPINEEDFKAAEWHPKPEDLDV